MLKLICITLVVVLYLDQEVLARIFNNSQLRAELIRQGFPENQLNDWVCLVMAESSGNTDAEGPRDSDGSHDWGLFQINDRYWCSSNGSPGKGCNVKCQDFIQDDITEASTCAKIIYQRSGFGAWAGWKQKCQK